MNAKTLEPSFVKKRASVLFGIINVNTIRCKQKKPRLPTEGDVESTLTVDTLSLPDLENEPCHPLSISQHSTLSESLIEIPDEITAYNDSLFELDTSEHKAKSEHLLSARFHHYSSRKKNGFTKRSYSQDNLLNLWPSINKFHDDIPTPVKSASSYTLHLDAAVEKSGFRKKEHKAIQLWQSTIMQKMLMPRKTCLPTPDHCAEKHRAIAKFITSELYATEKSFYQFLLFVRSSYMEPMEKNSQNRTTLFRSNDDVYVLFYHLPDLVSVASKMLYKLETYDFDDCPGLVIGRIFKELEQDLVIFLKYAVHYRGHMKAIRRASHSARSNNKVEYNRLGLADYLIAPFQRVPRYELLLNDLCKYATDQHEDLIYARNMISSLAATMNQVQQNISVNK